MTSKKMCLTKTYIFEELPPRRPGDHAIKLLPGDHKVDCETYNLTLSEQEELDKFLEETLKTRKIQPSKSQFASAFFFIKKKDGKLHPVQDYRKLNAITVKNWYPLPLINELIDKLKGTKYYTKLDIQWRYNNIWMKECNEWKAAFWTNRGLFEPLVMFFRLCNSPATFQTMMNHIHIPRSDQLRKSGCLYDDIMIFTKTLEEHWKIVWEVLQLLKDNHLTLKHMKCEFEKQETEYLGLIVAHNKVKVDQTKVKGVIDWPTPKMWKESREFSGFLNFYRRFIKDFVKVACPLNALTSEKKDFKWTDKCQMAFQSLKDILTSTPALAMLTKTNPFRVETDGSGMGLGTVLSQKQNDWWHPISFISRSLGDVECNYHAADLKMTAVIFALEEWWHYLLDAHVPFKILTDHKNLENFRKPQDLSSKQAQWNQ